MNEATSQASVRWTKNLQFVGLDADKRSLALDGLPEAGGEGTGFRPMQLLLIALAGCTAMDVASILRKQRQDLTALYVSVTGHRVEEHPRIFDQIRVEYVFRGRNLDKTGIEHAISLSETKYCSVEAMLDATRTRITSTYRILEEREAKA